MIHFLGYPVIILTFPDIIHLLVNIMTEVPSKQYVLKDNGSAKPAFAKEAAIVASQRSSADKILLSGGFSDRHAGSTFPVSAALQLNGDCTSMDLQSLAEFAEAELERHIKVSYRSYDIETDFRVCVLADNPSSLDNFFDTYGGILEIEPLLIGTYHQDYATAEEIDIVYSGRNYSLQYTLKSPVNHSKCTYCGVCGAICPEQCISENLRFDFSTCTFCTDCEKNCPESVIDLHGIERIEIDIPAIVILGEPSVALPEDSSSIYQQDQITDYLATLFSCSVDEVITCDHQICHFNAQLQTGCRACLSSCKYGAVKIDSNQISVDAFSCNECGSCVSICPTGAMQNRKLTDQSFIEFFRTFQLQQGTNVIVGSSAELNSFWWHNNQRTFEQSLFFEFPECEALSLMHLLFLIAHGADQIVVLSLSGEHNTNLIKAVREANLLCRKSFQIEDMITICKPESLSSQLAQQTSGDRSLKLYKDFSFINRRQKLSSLVEFFTSSADARLSLDKDEIRFWGTISCNENLCTQCLACLNDCKIESLSADSESLTLCWQGGLCIGCKSCVEICPEQALSFSGQADLSAAYFTSEVIASAEPMRCAECGKVFGTKKSFDRVRAILSKKQQSPPEHLQYCDDCRVLKLMESE